MICSHFVIHCKLVIIIIKTAKNSNAYHYYFKGIGWACADPGGGEAWGLNPIEKSHVIWVDLDLNPPPAPDEISWFRAWGGGAIYSLECIRTDCLMEDQARGGGVTLYQLGAK